MLCRWEIGGRYTVDCLELVLPRELLPFDRGLVGVVDGGKGCLTGLTVNGDWGVRMFILFSSSPGHFVYFILR